MHIKQWVNLMSYKLILSKQDVGRITPIGIPMVEHNLCEISTFIFSESFTNKNLLITLVQSDYTNEYYYIGFIGDGPIESDPVILQKYAIMLKTKLEKIPEQIRIGRELHISKFADGFLFQITRGHSNHECNGIVVTESIYNELTTIFDQIRECINNTKQDEYTKIEYSPWSFGNARLSL
jgi:hypothetical protein